MAKNQPIYDFTGRQDPGKSLGAGAMMATQEQE